MSQDLKLASDDDLIEELSSRYLASAIGLWRQHAKDNGLGVYKLRWRGDSFIATGLCSALQEEINRHRKENEDSHGQDD